MHTSQFLNNDGWFSAVTDIWCMYRNCTKHLLQGVGVGVMYVGKLILTF